MAHLGGPSQDKQSRRYVDFGGNQKSNSKNLVLDLDLLNSNSAVYTVFHQMSKQLEELHCEIQRMKNNLNMQDQQIIEKVRATLRQEISFISE